MEFIGYIITGVCSIIAVIITNVIGNSRISNEMKTSHAVTETKLTELTREVREHNQFASRIPVLEERLRRLEQEVYK